MTRKETVRLHLYTVMKQEKGFVPSIYKDKCRFSVWPTDGWRGYQCTRKPKTEIEGYGFCTQHAQKIERMFDVKE